MGCALAAVGALFFPRIVLVLVWLFGGGWLQAGFQTMLWPVLGFIFLPLTTLTWSFAWHLGEGTVQGVGAVLVALAVLLDIGLMGGGTAGTRNRSRGARS